MWVLGVCVCVGGGGGESKKYCNSSGYARKNKPGSALWKTKLNGPWLLIKRENLICAYKSLFQLFTVSNMLWLLEDKAPRPHII